MISYPDEAGVRKTSSGMWSEAGGLLKWKGIRLEWIGLVGATSIRVY